MLPNAVVVVYLFSAFFLITRGLVIACARAFKREKKFVAAGGKALFFWIFFLSVYGAYVHVCWSKERR